MEREGTATDSQRPRDVAEHQGAGLPEEGGAALGGRVPDGVGDIALRAIPRAGAAVQPGSQPRLGARKLQAQEIAEQVVVAEPLAAAVEGDQEQVRTLNLLQPGDPV